MATIIMKHLIDFMSYPGIHENLNIDGSYLFVVPDKNRPALIKFLDELPNGIQDKAGIKYDDNTRTGTEVTIEDLTTLKAANQKHVLDTLRKIGREIEEE